MKKYEDRQIWVYFRKLKGTSGNKVEGEVDPQWVLWYQKFLVGASLTALSYLNLKSTVQPLCSPTITAPPPQAYQRTIQILTKTE